MFNNPLRYTRVEEMAFTLFQIFGGRTPRPIYSTPPVYPPTSQMLLTLMGTPRQTGTCLLFTTILLKFKNIYIF